MAYDPARRLAHEVLCAVRERGDVLRGKQRRHPPERGDVRRVEPRRARDGEIDAVLLRVPHQLGRLVEPHRLGVDQGRAEHVRPGPFDPGRDVDQLGETSRVALREAIAAEPFDLVVTILRELPRVAARHHPAYEFFPETVDGADIAKCRHRAAQAVGFLGREFCRDNGKLHGLFLEQRNT